MAKKLAKSIQGNILKLEIIGGQTITVDLTKLPKNIQDNLKVSGLGHKLGDAAAGKETPEEIFESISAVLKGLEEGKWTTRLPASERITMSAIDAAKDGMSDKDKNVIDGLL